jgi:hypothetical protein
MASTTLHPGPAVHGATVLDGRADHPRHRLGDALRAVRVFTVAAVEVVILGNDDPGVYVRPTSGPGAAPP